MNGLNILITNSQAIKCPDRRATEPACLAMLRYNYSPERDDERKTQITIWAKDEFDPTAINAVGNKGAIVSYYLRADIDAAIATLRAIWGADLPVQMNLPAARIRDA